MERGERLTFCSCPGLQGLAQTVLGSSVRPSPGLKLIFGDGRVMKKKEDFGAVRFSA